MPFEQKYSTETRDASLATILKRRESEPGNRAIIRETAEQYEVGEQSLRGWIRAYEKGIAPEKAAEPAAPVASSPVASSPAKGSPTPVTAAETAPRRSPGRPSAGAASEARVSELEAEVAKLRRDREALKSALAVLLDD